MGLWTRMKRSVRALFGGIIEKTEDPELILQQTIRDMRDRVPELNNSVAQVMATEKLLAKNKERLETQVVDLDSKIRASVKMGRDDIATAYIGQLQQAQLDLQKTSQQLEHANLASKQALKARDNYVLQMQRRTAEAMQLINQSKQAKLQEQLAQTMESFQLGDDASTFNEMRDKIDRRAAAAEAKMQLGAASVDTQMQDIEREAMDMQLQDKLLAYKRDMGLLGAGASAPTPQALPAEGETHWRQNGTGGPRLTLIPPGINFAMSSDAGFNKFMAEFPKIDLKYLKEAFKEPINFWGMAGFAVAAAYVQDVTPTRCRVGY